MNLARSQIVTNVVRCLDKGQIPIVFIVSSLTLKLGKHSTAGPVRDGIDKFAYTSIRETIFRRFETGFPVVELISQCNAQSSKRQKQGGSCHDHKESRSSID